MLLDINEDNIIRIGDMLEDLVSSVKELGDKVGNAPANKPVIPRRGFPLDNMTLNKEWRIKRYQELCTLEAKKLREYGAASVAKTILTKSIGGKISECNDLDKLKDCFYNLVWEDGCQYICQLRIAEEE